MTPWAARVLALPQQALIGLVRAYRLLLKPWLGNACRFEPSCSAYTLAALQRHGALRGSAQGAWRLLRCQPWCDGGHDPVPENLPRLSPRLLHRLLTRLLTRLLPRLRPWREPRVQAGLPDGLFTRLGLTSEPLDAPAPDQPPAPSPTRKTP